MYAAPGAAMTTEEEWLEQKGAHMMTREEKRDRTRQVRGEQAKQERQCRCWSISKLSLYNLQRLIVERILLFKWNA